ncbi:MAG: acylphosphatase [Parcubacteria group bacterium]|nr:acylphosphatase [Parcubacteria group bacterium]
MNERLEALVSGRVQMVMYRDFVRRNATALKLMGEVKNLSDGTVLVIAEGTRPQLEKLLKKLRRGPFLASVTDIKITWLPSTHSFSAFNISYD